ncbi:AAA family ATPase [Desulfofustis limnaeus]|uniref:Transposase n=1 Tax=Desulfofustis limnaeus TaxID=2740163 RepID=A0ABM7W514_9BACT|nr:ATP-binding protein [Desulfofustis limnaeus]BDD85966.1 transposase [Desulfofustis limnaeus]
MKKTFAITKNVERFLAGMEVIEAPVKGRVGMGLVYGEPGTGKTEMTQKYAADKDYPYVRATDIMSRRSLLSKIVSELGEAPAFRSDELFNQAVDLLLDRPRTLIIDEVDYLCRGGMVEVLRDLNDVTNTPVVLVGMHQVDQKLKRYRHLWDRFSDVIRFRTFDADDIASLAEQICEVPISPEGIRFIHERGFGKFRRTMVWFSRAERVAKMNKLDVVDVGHLLAVRNGGE